MIVKANYVSAASRPQRARRPATPQVRLAKHLKYLEHRPHGEQETRASRHLFTAERDQVSRAAAVEAILANAHQSRAFYRIILSPDSREEEVTDWRDFTRRVLADYEERLGVPLVWVAAHHANTDHEHVHLVLSGGYRDARGALHLLRLDRADLAALRAISREHTEYDFRQQVVRHLEAEEAAERIERAERADRERRAQEQHLMAQQAGGRSQVQRGEDRGRQEDIRRHTRQADQTDLEAAAHAPGPRPMKERAALRADGLPLAVQARARFIPLESAPKVHRAAASDPLPDSRRVRPQSQVPPGAQPPQTQPTQQAVRPPAGAPRQHVPARTRTRSEHS